MGEAEVVGGALVGGGPDDTVIVTVVPLVCLLFAGGSWAITVFACAESVFITIVTLKPSA